MKGSAFHAAPDTDWGAVRKRLSKAFDASQDPTQRSPQLIRQILEDRARRLARSNVEIHAADATIDILAFKLGSEHYAIEPRYVREVLRSVELTEIPGVSDFVLGVANLRGEILAVFDLRIFFGVVSREISDQPRVIVCGEAAAEFGVIADSVQDVQHLSVKEFVSDQVFQGERGRECIRGVTRLAMVVIDGAALLNDRRLYNSPSGDVISRNAKRSGQC
jgi:purine-binding chemotaxis protein CheW